MIWEGLNGTTVAAAAEAATVEQKQFGGPASHRQIQNLDLVGVSLEVAGVVGLALGFVSVRFTLSSVTGHLHSAEGGRGAI